MDRTAAITEFAGVDCPIAKSPGYRDFGSSLGSCTLSRTPEVFDSSLFDYIPIGINQYHCTEARYAVIASQVLNVVCRAQSGKRKFFLPFQHYFQYLIVPFSSFCDID